MIQSEFHLLKRVQSPCDELEHGGVIIFKTYNITVDMTIKTIAFLENNCTVYYTSQCSHGSLRFRVLVLTETKYSGKN